MGTIVAPPVMHIYFHNSSSSTYCSRLNDSEDIRKAQALATEIANGSLALYRRGGNYTPTMVTIQDNLWAMASNLSVRVCKECYTLHTLAKT